MSLGVRMLPVKMPKSANQPKCVFSAPGPGAEHNSHERGYGDVAGSRKRTPLLAGETWHTYKYCDNSQIAARACEQGLKCRQALDV
jgi:hypothetical protein